MTQNAAGFSPAWDRAYGQSTHLSRWPWSDLVSLVMRHGAARAPGTRVLEVGVGAAANVPFFQSLGCDFYGIDGSITIVEQLRARFPELEQHFCCADFTKELPVPGAFDLIVDRASVTHNCEADIRRALDLIFEKLKPGGLFIGVDWFSTAHGSFLLGRQAEDPHTRTGIESGHLAGIGRVHFADAPHLTSLFAQFEILVLDHKVVEPVVPAGQGRLAWFHIVARKPLR